MNIIYHNITSPVVMTINEFANMHKLDMHVHERDDPSLPRYSAKFNAEVSDGRMLIGEYGNGSIPDEAIADYAKRISGKTLVYGAYTLWRREIKVPTLK